MSLAEQILGTNDIAEKLVEIPEWGVKVLIKGLTVAQVQQIRNTSKRNGEVDESLITVHSIIATCYDPETGTRIFEPAHRDGLMAKNPGIITRLTKEIAELSKLTPDAMAVSEKN